MKKLSTQKGFTLVEMIISLAIFTVVALVAVGALIKVMDANRKSISLKTTINNLNFALEAMTREIRVGKDYKNISSGSDSWTITFQSSEMYGSGASRCRLKYGYKYDGAAQTFLKAKQTTCTDSLGTSPSEYFPLISPEIKITTALVDVDNTNQPKVFLYIKGSSSSKAKDKTEFAVQTTISQRLPK